MDSDTVLQLRQLGLPWSKIASEAGVSRNSMYNFRKRYRLGEQNERISDQELKLLIRNIIAEYPTWGSVTLQGALLSMGIRSSENKIRATLREVDPMGVEHRRRYRLVRRVYSVPGANYLWHMDGHHKLIMFHLVIHGCIDGHSRKMIYLEVSTNNKAEPVLNVFEEALERSGLPRRVRGDRGCENVQVSALIQNLHGEENRYLFGRSGHNQRIERFWRDAYEKVVGLYKRTFVSMEDENLLHERNRLDLFCLQYVFLPRIQQSLNFFIEAWNNHVGRFSKRRSPNVIWLLNMRSQHPGIRFNTCSIHTSRPADHFIKSILKSPYLIGFPENITNLWVQTAVQLFPNPLVEDNCYGKNCYIILRNALMTLTTGFFG